MSCNLIAIKVEQRSQHVNELQKMLTEYGCDINVRVGFHETGAASCASDGVIVLQTNEKYKEILEKLDVLEGIKAKLIEF